MTINLEKIIFQQKAIDSKLARGSAAMQKIYNVSRNVEYQQYFEVGQVLVQRLIQKNWRDGNNDVGKLIVNDAGVVQKYVVANKLPGNLVLCRKLGISGRPGKAIHVIADVEYDRYRFEEDPDIADAILLDFDYDPMQLPKLMGRARRHRQTVNNKIDVNRMTKDACGRGYVQDSDMFNFLNDRLANGERTLWSMNETSSEVIKWNILEMDSGEIKMSKVGSTTEVTRNLYDLHRSYRTDDRFFVAEPVTQEQAMFRMQAKK